jgi:hypothetical protein
MSLGKPFFVVLLLAPMLAMAEPPAPRDPKPGPGPGSGPGHERGDRPPRRWGSEDREKDWKEAYAFFQAHSKRRAEAFAKMTAEQQEKFKPLIIARFNGFKWLSMGDQDMRKNRERQMEIEDDIYGVKADLMKPDVSAEQADRLKGDLRQKVKDLVETRMQERELRIKRLESFIGEEKNKLQQDQTKKDEVIDTRLKEILDAKSEDVIPDPRPPGPPGDGRRRE